MHEDIVQLFLIASVIPDASEHHPDGKNKRDFLWDAVWRAHRDTLQGRFHLEGYLKQQENEHPNKVAVELHRELSSVQSGIAPSSSALIEGLKGSCEDDVEYGAFQKLVNMTLKYLLILQGFDQSTDGSLSSIDNALSSFPKIDRSLCDCPLDSFVLASLRKELADKTLVDGVAWTSIDEHTYIKIQNAIDAVIRSSYPQCYSRLDYDFIAWTRQKLGTHSSNILELLVEGERR